MNIHVPRANMSRMLEVCWVSNHGAVDSPPPFRSGLLSDAARKALDPDVTHPVVGQLLAGHTLAAASSALLLRHFLCWLCGRRHLDAGAVCRCTISYKKDGTESLISISGMAPGLHRVSSKPSRQTSTRAS